MVLLMKEQQPSFPGIVSGTVPALAHTADGAAQGASGCDAAGSCVPVLRRAADRSRSAMNFQSPGRKVSDFLYSRLLPQTVRQKDEKSQYSL